MTTYHLKAYTHQDHLLLARNVLRDCLAQMAANRARLADRRVVEDAISTLTRLAGETDE